MARKVIGYGAMSRERHSSRLEPAVSGRPQHPKQVNELDHDLLNERGTPNSHGRNENINDFCIKARLEIEHRTD